MMHYTVEEGLSSSTVYKMVQSDDGMLYFGTDNGICSFNGIEFTHFTEREGLPDNDIVNIFKDGQGRIICSSFLKGFGVLENGKWEPFHQEFFQDLPPCFVRYSFLDSKKNLWLATDYVGVLKLDVNDNLVMYNYEDESGPSNVRLEMIGEGDGGTIHLISHNYWFTVNEATQSFKFEADLDPSGGEYSKVFITRDTFITSINEIIKVGRRDTLIKNMFQPKINVFHFFRERPEGGWSAGNGQGFFQFDEDFNLIHRWLRQTNISDCQYDREGNLWLSSIGNGIYMVPNEHSIQIKGPNENPFFLNIEKDENGNIWCGTTSNSIWKYGPEPKVFDLPPTQYLGQGHVTSMAFNKEGVAAIGRTMDLTVLTLNPFKIEGAVRSGSVKNISFLSRGPLIISSSSGTLKLDRYLHHARSRTGWENLNRIHSRSYSYYGDDPEVHYLGTNDSLIRYYPHSGKMEHIPEAGSGRIINIQAGPMGEIAFASSDHGVGVLINKKVFLIKEKHGLSSNQTYDLRWYKNDLWVATQKGLNKISPGERGWETPEVSIFGREAGIPTQEINGIVFRNDSIFISTPRGFATMPVSSLERPPVFPKINLRFLKVNGEFREISNEITLSSAQRNVEIGYSALCYGNRDKLIFRYKAPGENRGWDTTNTRELILTSLPFGEHILTLQAGLTEIGWSPEPIEIKLIVMTPFYRRPIFFVGVVLFLAMLVGGIFILRLQGLRRRQKTELELIRQKQKVILSQLNPHFLFNSLQSIQESILKGDKEIAHSYVSKFGKLMRRTLESLDGEKFTLEDELLLLKSYLEMEKMRLGDSFEYSIDRNGSSDLSYVMAPPMVTQIFAENAIWHGIRHLDGVGKLQVAIEEHEEYVLLTLKDNGVGRQKGQELKRPSGENRKSYGVSLIQKQMELVSSFRRQNIQYKIIDLHDALGTPKGTMVELEFQV